MQYSYLITDKGWYFTVRLETLFNLKTAIALIILHIIYRREINIV